MRALPLLLVICLGCIGCKKKEHTVSQDSVNEPHLPMIGTVMHSDIDEVRRLAAMGIGLNERAP